MTYGWQLTQEYLKSVLLYDPLTGVFKWISKPTPRSNKVVIGGIAGDKDARGYMRIGIKGHRYPSHRLAWLYMTGGWPKNGIDHINHDKSDNRWSNLRDIAHQDNLKNQRARTTNKSGVTGVSWDRARNKWYAYIRFDGKTIQLGRHEKLEDAKVAREIAKRKYSYHPNHGKYL